VPGQLWTFRPRDAASDRPRGNVGSDGSSRVLTAGNAIKDLSRFGWYGLLRRRSFGRIDIGGQPVHAPDRSADDVHLAFEFTQRSNNKTNRR
jgi:hypothetical protein